MAKGKTQYVKMLTPPFRISYPFLTEPQTGPGGAGTPKFSCQMLFPKNATGKDAELLKSLRECAKHQAMQFWPEKIPVNLKKPFKDGDTESDNSSHKGYVVANARTTQKPGVVNQQNQLLNDEQIARDIYPGCWCRASVLVGAGDNFGANYVHLILQNIQKLKDDEPFVSKKDASGDFEPVEFSPAQSEFSSGDGF